MNQSELVKKFFGGKEFGKASALSIDGDKLLSYDTPIAIRMTAESNLMNNSVWYLLNGEKYSITTSQHQSLTFSFPYPRIAFSTLPFGIKKAMLVDYTDDFHQTVYVTKENPEAYLTNAPIGCSIYPCRDIMNNGKLISKQYHRIGSVVLRCNNTDYLCSMDEGSYFVCELSRQVESVDDAFKSLIPIEVFNKPFLRHGEWFFIPAEQPCKIKDLQRQYVLPHEGQNFHVCSKGIKIDNTHYVSGIVRHQYEYTKYFTRETKYFTRETKRKTTGEHRNLKLAPFRFYQAIKNTAVNSWNYRGIVD